MSARRTPDGCQWCGCDGMSMGNPTHAMRAKYDVSEYGSGGGGYGYVRMNRIVIVRP